MLPSFASQTVTVIEPSWRDVRGTQTADYDHPLSATVVTGCSVQPGASSEDLQARTQATIRHTAYLPPGTPVTRHTAVVYAGERYSIEGVPAVWPSATGRLDHTVVSLIDWKG